MDTTAAREHDSDFLPDFCAGWTVFNVAVVAELLAFLVTIVSQRIFANLFHDLFLVSVFVQWIALSSCAALCLVRRYLNRLPPVRASIAAYLVLVGVAVLVAELAVWAMWGAGMVDSPRPDWYLYFHIQNLTVCAILDALALRYFLAKHQLKQKTLSEARARMQVMHYRMRPHFLFNSMNIIAALTRSAPNKAESAVEDLADLFRLMLDESKDLVPVVNEIAVAKKYVKLEKLRLDRRLNVNWEIGAIPRKAKMPVLMLQLLLENAIYHGIEPLPDGGDIQIGIGIEDDRLRVSASSPNTAAAGDRPPRRESATLDNIRQRLAMHFGGDAALSTREATDRFTVDLNLPAYGEHE